MIQQEMRTQIAKQLEGTTEEVIVTDCGMEAKIIYKIIDGEDYLKALDVLKEEEFGEQINIPGNSPGLEDLLVRTERAEACNPQLYLIESKQRRIMLEKEVLYRKAVIERKEFLTKEKDEEPLEITLDNIGPGYIISPSDNEETYSLLECILEPEFGVAIDYPRYRNELKRRVNLMVDDMEAEEDFIRADKAQKIDSEKEFYKLESDEVPETDKEKENEFLFSIKNKNIESLLKCVLNSDDYAPDADVYRKELKRRVDVMVDGFIEEG